MRMHGETHGGVLPFAQGKTEQPARSSRMQFSLCFSPASHASGNATMTALATKPFRMERS